MIASFLQQRQKLMRFNGVNATWNLGSLLLEFLSLYGGGFNYVQTGVSIADGGSYFKKRKRKADEAFSAR
jgi:non-canonical poly(A) RNA polymerase PAPD5/7